jgi:hypothetical protein
MGSQKMKKKKRISSKEPAMVKKTKFTDYEMDRQKSLGVTEDYKDFGNIERSPEKSKRWGAQERRAKEGA